jgi:predicted glutamine amidotransferase
MCLIIHREKDSDISKEFLENVREKNPDGWGILYHDREGNARVAKGLSMETFWQKYNRFLKYNSECIIHFRYATRGKVNKDNAHPYLVLGGDNPIYLMHNGTISIDGAEKEGKLSDTRVFIKDVLTPMLEHIKNPHEFIRTKHFEFMMESVAGDNSSRFVLFDHEGSLFYGGWYKTTKGVWVSNTYAYTVDNAYKKKTDYSNTNGGYWSNGVYTSPSTSNGKAIPFISDKGKDDSVDMSRANAYSAGYYEGTYDHYGYEDDDYGEEQDAWIQSIQDVADNFEVVAEEYWYLTSAEIEYAIQQFYEGNWEFILNENLPQNSVIRDIDGNVIDPDEIQIALSLLKADLIQYAKKGAA